jgi:spermidine synthase
VALAAIALGALSTTLNSPCDAETTYHCASIHADAARPGGRELLLDDLRHSYVDLNDPTHLEYPYSRWIGDAIDATTRPRAPLDAVVVGGGGFTLPRWVVATRPGSHVRVLEVDGELVDFVKRHLGLRTSPALRVSVGDARIGMLDVRSGSADVVIGDAFGSLAVPWHLTTVEWTDQVRRVLKPGGLYALNVIDLAPLGLLRAETATLLDVFADVRLVTYAGVNGSPAGGNAVLLASDRQLPEVLGSDANGATTYSRQAVEAFAAGAQTLRDDDAPVDQLLTTKGLS